MDLNTKQQAQVKATITDLNNRYGSGAIVRVDFKTGLVHLKDAAGADEKGNSKRLFKLREGKKRANSVTVIFAGKIKTTDGFETKAPRKATQAAV